MNSLTDLNNFSATSITFQDDRPPTFIWSDETPDHQYTTFYETSFFTSPVATNLLKVYSAEDYVTLTVNVAVLPGTTVTWSDPGTLTVTNPSTGVYSITGMINSADWARARSPVIIPGPTPPDLWDYTSTITYNLGNTKTWTTTVATVQFDQMSVASDYFYPDEASIIDGVPQVFELLVPNSTPALFTCNVTSSDNNVFGGLSAPGATFSDNTLYLSGNLATINNQLNNITFTPQTGVTTDWVATYTLWNPATEFQTVVTQFIKSESAFYLGDTTPFYYDEDIETQVTGTPTIVDVLSNVEDTYTMTISSLTLDAIKTLRSTGIYGNSSFAANVLTITGNKAAVNSHLGNVYYTTPTDYTTTFNLKYRLVAPGGNVAVRYQPSYKSSTNTTISNINVARTFFKNRADQIVFTSPVPQILENITGATYTISLSTGAGKFGPNSNVATSTYTFSGNKATVNSILSTVKFYPTKNVTGAQSFSYTQVRDGLQQVSTIIPYTGSTTGGLVPGQGAYSITSTSTFNLNYEQMTYLTANIMLVGGGGGGAWLGGGAGGDVELFTGQVLPYANVTIDIGVGGGGANYLDVGSIGGNTRIVKNGVQLFRAEGGSRASNNQVTGGTGAHKALKGLWGGNAPAGGGAGAFGNGVAGTSSSGSFIGGKGGAGRTFWANVSANSIGTTITVGGGGGGGTEGAQPGGLGGDGGGGIGGNIAQKTGYSGTAGLGGGGGGGSGFSPGQWGGSGGSGRVIIYFYNAD